MMSSIFGYSLLLEDDHIFHCVGIIAFSTSVFCLFLLSISLDFKIKWLKIFPNSLNNFSRFSVIVTMSYEVSTGPSDSNGSGPSIKDKDKCTEEKIDKNTIIAGLEQLRGQQKNTVIELTRIEDDKRELE